MKVVKVTKKFLDRFPSGSSARKCPCCQRAVKAGQHVLTQELRRRSFADSTQNLHVVCLAAKIENTPADDVEPTDLKAAMAAVRREAHRERRRSAEHAA